MANDIGSQRSVNTSSMALNTAKGSGAQKPMIKGGKDSPGDTKPPMPDCPPAPIAK